MDVSLDQPTPAKKFWRTWRREIIRGGVLFSLVLGAGLVLFNAKRNFSMPSSIGALGAFGDFNWDDGEGGDLFGRGRETGDAWEYRVVLKPSQQVWIKNTNGPIDVVAGHNDTLYVHAEKSWRHSEPGSVELVHAYSERGVTICALWQAREMLCEVGGEYRLNGLKKSDVAVRFRVELPRNIHLEASTVNGGLQIHGVSAPVTASTINGAIGVTTSSGPVRASTVNGSIEAVMHSLTGGDVRLTTVNGSVKAGLPVDLNANIEAETVNGSVETDLPVKVTGRISKRQLRGTIGTGGPVVKLGTVNGSITLDEAGPPMRHPTMAPRGRGPRGAPPARAVPSATQTPAPAKP